MFQAQDKDAGKFGKIEYRLVGNETDGAMYEYFSIDADSGEIKTQKPLETIPRSVLPIRLTVEARDNPQEAQNFNVARTEVVVSTQTQVCLGNSFHHLTLLPQFVQTFLDPSYSRSLGLPSGVH